MATPIDRFPLSSPARGEERCSVRGAGKPFARPELAESPDRRAGGRSFAHYADMYPDRSIPPFFPSEWGGAM